jgi:signal transduction histidine kinase
VVVRCCATSPNEVLVEIQDTGIGIPEDAMPQVFTKFFQVESGLRREQGGAGLGLAFSKLLIEAQGGKIGLESQPGAGTRVWFSLPVWNGEKRD